LTLFVDVEGIGLLFLCIQHFNFALFSFILAKVLVYYALCFISPSRMVWMLENWFSN